MWPLIIISLLLHESTSVEIDNKLVGEPEVDCQDTMVSLTFQTLKPFSGRIYVKGLSDDDRCSRNFASTLETSEFSLQIQQGECNMQRQRVFGGDEDMEGLVFSLVIVVSFHGTFVTKADRAFRCMCFFRNIKRVTNVLDMSMIGTTDLLDTAKMPTCEYSIRSGSPEGPLVKYAKIGDKIFHVWKCDDPNQGFLVHSCWVNDGRGNKFDLLDIDGCAIDPIIQPDVSYSEDLTTAHVETHGYKFSDTSVLDYMCVIELCRIEQGECDGVTPPTCGKGRRRRRAISTPTEGPEMDVTSMVRIIDTLDDEVNIAGPSKEIVSKLNENYVPPVWQPVLTHQGPMVGDICLRGSVFGLMLGAIVILLFGCLLTTSLVCYRKRRKM